MPFMLMGVGKEVIRSDFFSLAYCVIVRTGWKPETEMLFLEEAGLKIFSLFRKLSSFTLCCSGKDSMISV